MNMLRLLLRSVYLKGHQDGNMKTTDMSWEDRIVKDITKLLLNKKEIEYQIMMESNLDVEKIAHLTEAIHAAQLAKLEVK